MDGADPQPLARRNRLHGAVACTAQPPDAKRSGAPGRCADHPLSVWQADPDALPTYASWINPVYLPEANLHFMQPQDARDAIILPHPSLPLAPPSPNLSSCHSAKPAPLQREIIRPRMGRD